MSFQSANDPFITYLLIYTKVFSIHHWNDDGGGNGRGREMVVVTHRE